MNMRLLVALFSLSLSPGIAHAQWPAGLLKVEWATEDGKGQAASYRLYKLMCSNSSCSVDIVKISSCIGGFAAVSSDQYESRDGNLRVRRTEKGLSVEWKEGAGQFRQLLTLRSEGGSPDWPHAKVVGYSGVVIQELGSEITTTKIEPVRAPDESGVAMIKLQCPIGNYSVGK